MKHIMIDLEMNKIKKQYREDKKLSNELIEIGAVKMDDDFNEVDRYQTYQDVLYQILPKYPSEVSLHSSFLLCQIRLHLQDKA